MTKDELVLAKEIFVAAAARVATHHTARIDFPAIAAKSIEASCAFTKVSAETAKQGAYPKGFDVVAAVRGTGDKA
ncbi:TPA: hypothetical protein ACOEBN_000805 [Stenotrophomonas maltophilia]